MALCTCDPHFAPPRCAACATGYAGTGCATCDTGFHPDPRGCVPHGETCALADPLGVGCLGGANGGGGAGAAEAVSWTNPTASPVEVFVVGTASFDGTGPFTVTATVKP